MNVIIPKTSSFSFSLNKLLYFISISCLFTPSYISAQTIFPSNPTVFVEDYTNKVDYQRDCAEIKDNFPSSDNGYYLIKPADGINADSFRVYCNMTTEGGGWTRIYIIDDLRGGYGSSSQQDVNYEENLSAMPIDYDNVAYLLTLDTEYIWTSMSDFSSGNLDTIGVPNSYTYDDYAYNLTVISNAPNVRNFTRGVAKLEFWRYDYSTTGGDNGIYDYDDQHNQNNNYGSWQIHDGDRNTTLWSWNRWGGGLGEGGIGNAATGHPDWTFHDNAASYTKKIMEIYVK